MKQPTVTAVIVTYNRAEKVQTTIEHVLAQSYPLLQLVVVDNASTDGTDEMLEKLAAENEIVQHYRSPENLGGAGGFAKGIKIAFNSGSDYIWVMDDDCYAYPDALEQLVKGWERVVSRTGHVPGFACSLVKWHDDVCEMNIPAPVWDYPRHFHHDDSNTLLVSHCSFVSVMFHRSKVAEVGLPISEFFIWFDDVEYTKRLAKRYPGIYVLASQVHHDLPDNKGVNFGLITKDNLWKYRYGARNQAYYHKENSLYDWGEFFLATRRTMLNAKVPFAMRKEIYKSMLEGLFMKVKIETVS